MISGRISDDIPPKVKILYSNALLQFRLKLIVASRIRPNVIQRNVM